MEDLVHITIIVLLLIILYKVSCNCYAAFKGDPFGTGLRYQTTLDSANQGNGTNTGVLWPIESYTVRPGSSSSANLEMFDHRKTFNASKIGLV